ncbi:MAG: kipI [Planctomycetota bacterium]|nr:kipI [Planctomycetota bacterium]
MIALDPLGDRGFLARFGSEAEARDWAEATLGADLPGVLDVVLAYRAVGVFADPERVKLEALAQDLAALTPPIASGAIGRLRVLPVLYDGEDLREVAERVGKSVDEVISLHSGREYRVLAVGFLPGFPYAGDLAPELSGLARRDQPRTRVPAGSVAIAGRQTGVYPGESPGGWHLLGRTPLRIVDADREFFPIRAGDRLRFVPMDRAEYSEREGEWLA